MQIRSRIISWISTNLSHSHKVITKTENVYKLKGIAFENKKTGVHALADRGGVTCTDRGEKVTLCICVLVYLGRQVTV